MSFKGHKDYLLVQILTVNVFMTPVPPIFLNIFLVFISFVENLIRFPFTFFRFYNRFASDVTSVVWLYFLRPTRSVSRPCRPLLLSLSSAPVQGLAAQLTPFLRRPVRQSLSPK